MVKNKQKEKITDLNEYKAARQRRFDFARGVVLTALALLVCLALYTYRDNLTTANARCLLSQIRSAFSREGGVEGTISFDADSRNVYGTGGDRFYALGSTGLRIFSSDGSENFYQYSFRQPALARGGKFFLAYDIGGGTLAVLNGESVLKNLTFDYNIIKAAVSDSGFFAVATRDKVYHALVTVFNRNMQEVFKWYSNSRVTDLALAPDDKSLCVAVMDLSGGTVNGGVVFFKLDRDRPAASKYFSGSVVLEVKYRDLNLVTAVTDGSVAFFDGVGAYKTAYSFEGRVLRRYSTAPRKNTVLVLSADSLGKDSSVVVLGPTGEETARFGVEEEIRDLAACDDKILVLTDVSLKSFDMTGKLLEEVPLQLDIRSVGLDDNGDCYLIGTNFAQYLGLA